MQVGRVLKYRKVICGRVPSEKTISVVKNGTGISYRFDFETNNDKNL